MEFNVTQFGAPSGVSPWSNNWISVPYNTPVLDPGITTFAAAANETVDETIIIYPATNQNDTDNGNDGANDGANDHAAVVHKSWPWSVYESIPQLPKVDLLSQLSKDDLLSQLSKVDLTLQLSMANLFSQLSKFDFSRFSMANLILQLSDVDFSLLSKVDLISQLPKVNFSFLSKVDLFSWLPKVDFPSLSKAYLISPLSKVDLTWQSSKASLISQLSKVDLIWQSSKVDLISQLSKVDLMWQSSKASLISHLSKVTQTISSMFDLATDRFGSVYGTVAPMTTAAVQRVATTYSHVLRVLSIPIPMLSAAPVAPPPNRFLRVLAMVTPSHPPAIVKVFRYAFGTMTPPRFPAPTPTWKLILYLLELRVPPQLVPPASFWRIWFLAPQPVADTTMASTIIVVSTVVMALAACWSLCTMARKPMPSQIRWLSTATLHLRRSYHWAKPTVLDVSELLSLYLRRSYRWAKAIVLDVIKMPLLRLRRSCHWVKTLVLDLRRSYHLAKTIVLDVLRSMLSFWLFPFSLDDSLLRCCIDELDREIARRSSSPEGLSDEAARELQHRRQSLVEFVRLLGEMSGATDEPVVDKH